ARVGLWAQALATAGVGQVAEPAERRHRFLAEAAGTLATSLDYRLTLRRLARLVVPDLADWCSVDIVEADGSIQSVALAHADPERVQGALELRRRYPPGADSAVANVVASGQTALYEKISDDV